ncbi:carboxypeptidase-like regulatory domain-containing protein [Rubrivirga sp. S365]|uniref:Carboxypeptidase-like regulatory domain-containing protein n=1 Tax=Rubrivirga litoralis TaxID=3075598 RepID=A0ABU3BVF7_9BACT|nr:MULTISPECIES: carboxypeptidase-like regulatory domain-containing protein [unclassified Rubrivirga]MDT0633285.1 carboxypeptidase-like regulatory domain-containing protein [Rubrivirga sp. F394]MDT7856902.1 carboxypeptidase-like regulatory domain-containing protein [Rubrivirga sp. S365]
MRRLLPALAVLLLCADASAQRVVGVVTSGDAAVPGATVRLVSGADTVAATAADADGRFLIRAPGAGRYRLVVTAVGYGPATGEPFALSADASQVVDVDLRPAVGDLGGVAVEAGRRTPAQTLNGVGFYERRDRGMGRFFDRRQIEDRRPRKLTDLFAVLPGFVPLPQEGDVRISSINSIVRGTNCRPTIVVDGTVLRSFGDPIGSGSGLPTNPLFNLDAALGIDQVEAVEAYAHNGIPAQYGGTMSPCGAVLIWTRSYAEAADPGDSVARPPGQ